MQRVFPIHRMENSSPLLFLPSDIVGYIFSLCDSLDTFVKFMFTCKKLYHLVFPLKLEQYILNKFNASEIVPSVELVPGMSFFRYKFITNNDVHVNETIKVYSNSALKFGDTPKSTFICSSYSCDICQRKSNIRYTREDWYHCIDCIQILGKCDIDFCSICLNRNPELECDHTLVNLGSYGSKEIALCKYSAIDEWIQFMTIQKMEFLINKNRISKYYGVVVVCVKNRPRIIGSVSKFKEAFYNYMIGKKSILVPWINNEILQIENKISPPLPFEFDDPPPFIPEE